MSLCLSFPEPRTNEKTLSITSIISAFEIDPSKRGKINKFSDKKMVKRLKEGPLKIKNATQTVRFVLKCFLTIGLYGFFWK